MKYSSSTLETISVLPGSMAVFDKACNVLSSSEEWKTTVKPELEIAYNTQHEFTLNFENSIQEAFRKGNAHFIVDVPVKQVRYKYKFSKFETEGEALVLAQRILSTRPKEYRKEELLKQTNKVAYIGFWELNLITKSIYWSEVTRKIHEIPDDFKLDLDTGINFYKQGEDRSRLTQVINRAIEFGESWDEDFTLITYTGKEVYVNARGKAEFEDEKCVRLLGTFQDITDRVVKNDQLRISEEQFRLAFENTPIAFLIIDVESFKILEVNEACEKIFGYNKNQFLKKKITDLYRPDEFQKNYLLIKNLFHQNSRKIENEQNFLHKNGNTILAKTYFSLNYDSKGKPNKIIAQIQDITELKKQNEEINRFVEVTTNQNTRLINFAHIVSHNLRSHSSNIGMLIEFLKNEKDEEEREMQFEMLAQASSMLTETISHLNEVVSVDINYQDKEELDLYKYIENGIRSVRGLMVEVNFQILNRVHEGFKIYAVPAYLESIILNIITNSIKYRDPKRKSWLQISAERINGYVIITASDNGLGINLERYGDRIFGLYKTFHEHSDARGLGLYMTKSQVEVMGGSINVQSKVGKGTTFIIKLNEKN
ncbi:sensor histidine kinase [Leeuwenhoekiella sp. MAR_2009_132]|uniref:sensor histidine kinase n=1 Tax=Leeuwenhoekiella sp. MAR_2009_132 TaxID=1392489 RepID=UPI00048A5F74|nr:PAS domain S-box protein [Leeuwenhoekiella sp. MAR_2009_132]